MTMGNSWSYVPDDTYKQAIDIVHTLIKIVSRGGNYLLNIGPGPHGDWDPDAYDPLKAVGEWMALNGEGIYATRAVGPYSEGRKYYTRGKDDSATYVFDLSETEKVELPATIRLTAPEGRPVKQIELLGVGKLRFKQTGDSLGISIPENKRSPTHLRYAATFKLVHQ